MHTVITLSRGYDHMTFFNRHRYSGHDSFKTVLSKARRKKFSP